jgi:hypothetical protein
MYVCMYVCMYDVCMQVCMNVSMYIIICMVCMKNADTSLDQTDPDNGVDILLSER